jgi:transcriptional regulator with XRE-family HTH domain
MTTTQFTALATKLFGADHGWQKRCADALGVDKSTVSRWVAGGDIPGPVAAALECWNDKKQVTRRK